MQCGNALTSHSPTELTCNTCKTAVPVLDGIIDFVDGSATTALDAIDYDDRYGINDEHSLNLYTLLRSSSGPLWPKDLGDALEVGCGTGGLSLALLGNVCARHVVLTDVSPKMLRQCRQRLHDANNPRGTATTFATYAGTQNCFRPNTFDTCFGTAVVHHITDVTGFLSHVHTVLKPGGCAFFMEPSLPFHRALTATVADIVADLLHDPRISDNAISLMLNWTGEVHCNIVNTGDIEVLAEREDKHLFDPDTFAAWAESAGFARVAALPCGLDPTGWGTVQVYFHQTGLSTQALAAVEQLWPAKHTAHFAGLAVRDQSPSYLFRLKKGTSAQPRPTTTTTAATTTPTTAPVSAPLGAATLPTRTWLVLGLHRRGQDLEISVAGWCLSAEPARSVRFATCGVIRRVPIWRPRPDVQREVNRNAGYPPLHALCSGIEGTARLGPDLALDTIDVEVAIVTAGDVLRPCGTVSLTVGAPNVEIGGSFQ
jgi:SAM-dependent methyltransferase